MACDAASPRNLINEAHRVNQTPCGCARLDDTSLRARDWRHFQFPEFAVGTDASLSDPGCTGELGDTTCQKREEAMQYTRVMRPGWARSQQQMNRHVVLLALICFTDQHAPRCKLSILIEIRAEAGPCVLGRLDTGRLG